MHQQEEVPTTNLLNALSNIPVDEAVADRAGRLIYKYARQGVQLSLPDAFIAATALIRDLTLVTTNVRHFPLPDLKINIISQ